MISNKEQQHKLCIVTGSRAEYGLFYPLLKRLRDDQTFKLQIIATGMHLSPLFGLTYKEIEKDGFKINEKVNMLSFKDTVLGVTKSMGIGICGLADAFNILKPDAVVLMGDRYETFSAAVAAFMAKIPIVHLSGGELTEGVVDDALRHSITKMSYLHFVATNQYRERVIQLGEEPGRVFKVGALGIDNIKNLKLLRKKELEKELNYTFNRRTVLVTFHPVTLENDTSAEQFKNFLAALDYFKNLKVIFTKPNADHDNRVISKLIDDFLRKNPGKAISFISLGTLKYLSILQYVDAVVGNSSSGIAEVPSFGKPTVNIGDRQKGRIQSPSVINCLPNEAEIIKAMKKAFSPQFKAFCKKVKNPYGDGRAANRIVKILRVKLGKIKDLKKKFYDLKMDKAY